MIVSCQASTGEPLCKPEHILAFSLTVLNGGASALRLEGTENIQLVRSHTDVPIVGITKIDGLSEEERLKQVYITATFKDASEVVEAGADIVALDATLRDRPDGLSLKETISKIHNDLKTPVWADVATFEEAKFAHECGANLVSTTLYGYTEETYKDYDQGPGFDLLKKCVAELPTPTVMEGRVWEPEHVQKAIELGAYAVVVGSAITRPHLITSRFVKAIPSLKHEVSGT